MHNHRLTYCRNRRGCVTVLMAVLITLLAGMLAFSIDISIMQLTRTQMRVATDAASRAAAEAIVRTEDPAAARAAAKLAAKDNLVNGVGLVLQDSDIVFGSSAPDEAGKWHFTANQTPYNSALVDPSGKSSAAAGGTLASDGDSDGEGSGGVPLFFARLWGRSEFKPSMTTITARTSASKRDFAIVVDRSGSMNGSVGGGISKWQATKDAIELGFTPAINASSDDEKVGLASYSSSATLDLHLTTNYQSIMDELDTRHPSGSTNIHDGIQQGRAVLNASGVRPGAQKVLVVMTDGRHNSGPEPINEANKAAQDGIVIFSITFGSNADTKRMKDVAAATGGKHFHAPTNADLQDVFKEVAEISGTVFVK